MDIKIKCTKVEVEPNNSHSVIADLGGIDVAEVVEDITIQKIIEAVGAEKFLDAIGHETARDHFGLVEAED